MFKIKKTKISLKNGLLIKLTEADQNLLYSTKTDYEKILNNAITAHLTIISIIEEVIELIKQEKIPINSPKVFKLIQKIKVNKNLFESTYNLIKQSIGDKKSNLLNFYKNIIANLDIKIEKLRKLTGFA